MTNINMVGDNKNIYNKNDDSTARGPLVPSFYFWSSLAGHTFINGLSRAFTFIKNNYIDKDENKNKIIEIDEGNNNDDKNDEKCKKEDYDRKNDENKNNNLDKNNSSKSFDANSVDIVNDVTINPADKLTTKRRNIASYNDDINTNGINGNIITVDVFNSHENGTNPIVSLLHGFVQFLIKERNHWNFITDQIILGGIKVIGALAYDSTGNHLNSIKRQIENNENIKCEKCKFNKDSNKENEKNGRIEPCCHVRYRLGLVVSCLKSEELEGFGYFQDYSKFAKKNDWVKEFGDIEYIHVPISDCGADAAFESVKFAVDIIRDVLEAHKIDSKRAEITKKVNSFIEEDDPYLDQFDNNNDQCNINLSKEGLNIPFENSEEKLFIKGFNPFIDDLKESQNINGIMSLNDKRDLLPSLIVQDDNINKYYSAEKDENSDKIETRNCVYIHCKAGVGRSWMILMCYLVLHKNMIYDEAYEIVIQKRSKINPSVSQEKFVKAFEKKYKNNCC